MFDFKKRFLFKTSTFNFTLLLKRKYPEIRPNIRPDIRNPVRAGYPAGYPESGGETKS